ncbi:MAG TPA: hypothetical protein VII25_11460, partial [Candidatus Acidoferrum sp.]
KDQASVEFYDIIFTVAESPKQKGVIWAGTDDGLIQVTRDDGKNWANVTPKGIPEWSLVSLIEASAFDPGTAYAAVDARKLDNFKPYIFKTADFGKTWTQITTGIPDGAYVHAVREDPVRKGLLFAGTELGIYVSFDDGGHWQSLQLKTLPVAPVHDMVIHGNDLVVATHGRAFWILDDISPLRQADAAFATSDAHFFTPATAIRTRTGHSNRRRYAIGENPLGGAILYYYLKEDAKEPIKLEILDVAGKIIRNYTSEEKKKDDAGEEEFEKDDAADHIPAKAGLNLFSWDMRYQEPVKVPKAVYDEGEPAGPLVLPGKYQVRLTVAGKSITYPLEVVMDPRVKTSATDLQTQFDLMLKLRDRQEEMNKAILGIRDLRGQLLSVEKRLGAGDSTKPLREQSEALRKKISSIENELVNPEAKASEDELNYPTKLNSKLGFLTAAVDSADAAPTEGEQGVFDALNPQLETQLVRWREITAKEVPALNEALRSASIPIVAAK